MKVGNTRSVGVNPNQCACNSGGYEVSPLPGVFTMIMKQIVIPRSTSRARNRWGELITSYYASNIKFLFDQQGKANSVGSCVIDYFVENFNHCKRCLENSSYDINNKSNGQT